MCFPCFSNCCCSCFWMVMFIASCSMMLGQSEEKQYSKIGIHTLHSLELDGSGVVFFCSINQSAFDVPGYTDCELKNQRNRIWDLMIFLYIFVVSGLIKLPILICQLWLPAAFSSAFWRHIAVCVEVSRSNEIVLAESHLPTRVYMKMKDWWTNVIGSPGYFLQLVLLNSHDYILYCWWWLLMIIGCYTSSLLCLSSRLIFRCRRHVQQNPLLLSSTIGWFVYPVQVVLKYSVMALAMSRKSNNTLDRLSPHKERM